MVELLNTLSTVSFDLPTFLTTARVVIRTSSLQRLGLIYGISPVRMGCGLPVCLLAGPSSSASPTNAVDLIP